MKRLPLTQEDRLLLKAIEKYAVVVLLMFKIHPFPVNEDSLAFEMKWDRRTAKTRLDGMASDGLTLLVKGEGYVLNSQARFLMAQFLGDVITVEAQQALAQSPALVAGTSEEAQAHQALDPLPASPIWGEHQNGEGEGAQNVQPLHTMCALKKVEEESLTLKDSESSTSLTSKSAQNVQFQPLTTENILAASEILFGEGRGVFVAGLSLDMISPDYALACLAHAYAESSQLRNPPGVAYNMLKSESRHSSDYRTTHPRRDYRHSPMTYLPNEFKEIFGMAVYACPWQCGQSFARRADLEEHAKNDHQAEEPDEPEPLQADASINAKINGRMTMAQAWHAVLGQLQMEMPRASFDTWVRDTFPVRYDGNVLEIGARNAYAWDWLESHLTSTVDRLLVGILNMEVSVQFVVSQARSESE